MLAIIPTFVLLFCCYVDEPRQRITTKMSSSVTSFICGLLGALPIALLEIFLLWLYSQMIGQKVSDQVGPEAPVTPQHPKNVVLTVWLSALVLAFIVAALCEETLKYILVKVASRSIDNPHSVVVIALSGALGFATVENLFYVYAGGLTTALTRALVSVPMHGMTGCIIGAYIARDKFIRRTEPPKSYCWIIRFPWLLHGTFDFPVMVVMLYGKTNDMTYMWVPLLVCPAIVIIAYCIFRSISLTYEDTHDTYVRTKLGLTDPDDFHRSRAQLDYPAHHQTLPTPHSTAATAVDDDVNGTSQSTSVGASPSPRTGYSYPET